MAGACHSKSFAAKVKIPQKVACDFNKADTGGMMLRKKK
jgi:hypothetical protein